MGPHIDHATRMCVCVCVSVCVCLCVCLCLCARVCISLQIRYFSVIVILAHLSKLQVVDAKLPLGYSFFLFFLLILNYHQYSISV